MAPAPPEARLGSGLKTHWIIPQVTKVITSAGGKPYFSQLT